MDASFLDLLMAQQEEVTEAEGGGGIWIVADVVNNAIAPVTLEAIGAARNLGGALGAYVYAVLLGSGVSDLASTLYQAGADGVRVADDPSLATFAVEPYLETLVDLFKAEQPEVVIFGATWQGQELAPHLAQRTGSGLLEHVVAMTLDEVTRTVQAAIPIYGGEYFEIMACPQARPQVLTVEPGAFPAPFMDPYRKGEPKAVAVKSVEPRVRVLGPADDFTSPEVPLAQAPVIVAAGQQAGDFSLVEQLAAALGGRVAGDRGARDAGWIGPEQIVDIRGVTVAPEVYVAVGIRGDTYHNAAIENSRFILAIHPDPTAPIFQVADLCIEADPKAVLTALIAALE